MITSLAPKEPPVAQRNPAVVAIGHTTEKHRSIERVTALTRQTINLIGAISRFVRKDQTVLIKPNQTVYFTAEEGCTTDPYLIGALIRLAKEAGAARIQVAESSGEFFGSIKCMQITGVAAMAEKEGAELIDLGTAPTREVQIPNGKLLRTVPLPEPLLDADVIIDCP